MMVGKSEVVSHFLVTFGYFVLVLILRLGVGRLGELGWLGMLGILGGGLLGTFFLDFDHLVYWLATHPEAEDSKEARETIRGFRGAGDVRETTKKLYDLLKKVHFTHTRLVFHSVIGQVILLILAFYLLSSGGSIFGSAFILSVNLHLLKDEWTDYQKDRVHLADWLFWQVRGVTTEKQLTIYLIVVTTLFLFLTTLVL